MLDMKKRNGALMMRSMSAGHVTASSPHAPVDCLKCNTPEMQRKNLFDMAKTTVDKVKQNVIIKPREWISMVYSPNEGRCEADETDK